MVNSAMINSGKIILPSVESWGTNMNIKKESRSYTTRKIDKVGSEITDAIANSDDRYNEAINYYPRGVNPMVSVNYNNGQKLTSITNNGEAYPPYQIGVFRPPIRRQEDLLPRSRLPRVLTEVYTQKHAPIYTLRIKNCGTAETTKEVKTKLLTTSYDTIKTISRDPNINVPELITRIHKPLVLGQITAQKSNYLNNSENKNPVILLPSNRPIASGFTNPIMIKEKPIICKNIKLTLNHPTTQAYTNLSAPFVNKSKSSSFNRLHPTLNYGSCPIRPGVPSVTMNHPEKQLIRVR